MNMRSLFETASPVAMPSLWKGRPMIVDSFAGGGGASTGIEMALGRSPDIAINHNPAALALHAANHPETLHLSENVYKVDPLDHMRGRHIGLMHFSPDCKHFSKAKGGKPVERNIRDLAWIIPGWIERIQKSGGKVDVVTMENVEEWKDWGPLVQTERGLMPCPDRRGQTFDAWCKAIRKLGGKIDWRELRACDYGAPTIRKRLFLIVRFDGKPIVWPEPTHGDPKSEDVIEGRKLPWRCAAEIIDWSLPCPSIFDTKAEIWEKHHLRAVRPLADKSMARFARGLKRHVLDAGEPCLVSLKGSSRRARSAMKPHPTICAEGGHSCVLSPIITYAQQGGGVRSVEVPHHTITASGNDQNAVIVPHLTAFYGPGAGGKDRSADASEPLRTITTENRHAIAAVFVAQQNNDVRRIGGVNPGRGADEPLSTVTATGSQQSPVTAFIARQFGNSTGSALDEPLGAVMGREKDQFVAPYLAAYYGVEQDTPMDEPLHTVTTKPRFGHVEALLDIPPFRPEQEARAREVADFMRSHGFWDEREFVTLTIGGITIVIVDIGMRMLTPRELFNAQGFPPDYVIDGVWEGEGEARRFVEFPKDVQVSCCGNSVSPYPYAAIVAANCGDLVEIREAAE